jgi:hypothetical protein
MEKKLVHVYRVLTCLVLSYVETEEVVNIMHAHK